MPLPRATVIRRDASKQALAELEELLEAGYDDPHAAEELNLRGYRDSLGGRFNVQRIRAIRVRHKMPGGIERQREKMRAQGYKTAKELAAELAIDAATVGRLALPLRLLIDLTTPFVSVTLRACRGHLGPWKRFAVPCRRCRLR